MSITPLKGSPSKTEDELFKIDALQIEDSMESEQMSPIKIQHKHQSSPNVIHDLMNRALNERLEAQLSKHLEEIQHAAAKTDLNSQRALAQIKTLQNEFQSFKQGLESGGGIATQVQRIVRDLIEKENSKEPEAKALAQRAKDSQSNQGILKEFVVMSEQIRLVEKSVNDLQRNLRQTIDEQQDLRGRVQIMYHKIDEKTSKVYVDYCISTCLPKEAINPINYQLEKAATKEELSLTEKSINERVSELQRIIDTFKTAYASKEEVWQILDKNLDKTKGLFMTSTKFDSYCEQNDEKVNTMLGEQAEAKSRMNMIDHSFKQFNIAIANKAENSSVLEIKDDLLNYSRYTDMKELYNKVMPQLLRFDNRLVEFNNNLEQNREMIQRIDEILNTKVNKHTFDQLQTFARTLSSIDLVVQKDHEQIKRTDIVRKNLESLRTDYLFFVKNLKTEISNIVRKQTANIRNQLMYHTRGSEEGGSPVNGEGASVSVNVGELKKLILNKMDKVDMEQLVESKASKRDTKNALLGVEQLHKHISHIMVILMEIARHVGLGPADAERLETEKARGARRAYLHKQMMKVSKWIFQFSTTFEAHASTEEEQLVAQVADLQKRGTYYPYQDETQALPDLIIREKKKSDNILSVDQLAEQEISTPREATGGRHTANRASKRESQAGLLQSLQSLVVSSPELDDDQPAVSSQANVRMGAAIKGGIPSMVRHRMMLDRNRLLSSSVQNRAALLSQPSSTHRTKRKDFINSNTSSLLPEEEDRPFILKTPHSINRTILNTTVDPATLGQSSLQQNSLGATTLGGAFSIMESPNRYIGDDQNQRKLIGIHEFKNQTLINKSLEVLKEYQEGRQFDQAKQAQHGPEEKPLISPRTAVVLQRRVLSPHVSSSGTGGIF